MSDGHRHSDAWGLGIALLLAIAQFRLIAFVFGSGNYGRAVEAALGVVEGKPHWRIFQNRILGPYLVKAASKFMPSFLDAHVLFSVATLWIAGFIAWRVGRRIGGRLESALLAVLVFHASFAFFLTPPWLYAWDYLDAILFLVFVDFVIGQRDWRWFTGLFAIAILNRESALFIAIWMILDPLVKAAIHRAHAVPGSRDDRRMFVAGVACLVVGLSTVELLRQVLLVEEVGPKIFTDAPPEKFAAFRLPDNLRIIAQLLSHFDYSLPYSLLFLVGGTIAAATFMARSEPKRYLGLALTYLALLASTLTFGIFLESRVFVDLIPLLVAGTVFASTGMREQAR